MTEPNKPVGNPLLVREVPEKLRDIYDFTSQVVEYYPGRKKRIMTIQRTCPECHSVERVSVTQIRSALRLGTLRGLCRKCFYKMSRPQPKGEESPKWQGGRRETPKGYIMILCPEHPRAQSGYVFEHRLVMEKHLGRFLLPTETVHHKNGIKSDNRYENLELWSKSHSDGIRYEDMNIQQLEQLVTFLQELLAKRRLG